MHKRLLTLWLENVVFFALLPSEHVSGEIYDHEREPRVDNAPDGEGPARRGDVCLIASGHVTCGAMEGTWETTGGESQGVQGCGESANSRETQRDFYSALSCHRPVKKRIFIDCSSDSEPMESQERQN